MAYRIKWFATGTIANGVATSSALKIGQATAGCVSPSYDTGSCAWHGSQTEGGTYEVISNAAGTPVASVVGGAAEWVGIPEEVFAFEYVKIVGTNNASGGQTVDLALRG